MYTKSKKIEPLLMVLAIFVLSLLTYILYLSSLIVTKVTVLPVRNNANDTLQLSYVLTKDDRYTIINRKDEWAYIQFYDGKTGWIHTNDSQSSSLDALKNVVAVTPTKSAVPVFENTRATDIEVGKLEAGTTYYKFFERNNWAQIIYNNRIVWVENSNLKTIK